MQIGTRIFRHGRTCAFGIERRWVVGIFGVAQIDPAEAREGLTMAAGTRRHDAIEHVDAARRRFENVLGRADPHEIARPAVWQVGQRMLDRLEHELLAFAHRKSADRIALEADPDELLSRLAPEAAIDPALHDAKIAAARL